VIFHGDRAVLRRANDGAYVFPKGHVEPGESLEETAIREALEETGLHTRVVAPLGTHLFPYKQKMRHVTWYLMEATGETDDWQTHLGKDTIHEMPGNMAHLLLVREEV